MRVEILVIFYDRSKPKILEYSTTTKDLLMVNLEVTEQLNQIYPNQWESYLYRNIKEAK